MPRIVSLDEEDNKEHKISAKGLEQSTIPSDDYKSKLEQPSKKLKHFPATIKSTNDEKKNY